MLVNKCGLFIGLLIKTFIRENINLKVSPGVIQCQNEYKKFFCSIHNFMFYFSKYFLCMKLREEGKHTESNITFAVHILPFHFPGYVKISTYMTLFHWVLSAQSAWYIICTVRLSYVEGFIIWTLSTSAWQFSLWFSILSLIMSIWMAMLNHNQPVHPGKGNPITCPQSKEGSRSIALPVLNLSAR